MDLRTQRGLGDPVDTERVKYRLTALGEGLRDVLDAVGTWAMSIPEPFTAE